MIKALKVQGIYDSTLFIVTAKHGQTPINPVKTHKPGHFADVVASLPDGTTNPRPSPSPALTLAPKAHAVS